MKLKTLAILAVCLTLIPGVWSRAQAQIVASTVEPDVPEKAGKDLKALRAAGAARAVAGMAFYTGRLDREAVALEFGT